MARLSAARKAALQLAGRARRRDARMRDLARNDASLAALSPEDRALAFRLVMGVACATPVLDGIIDSCLKRPSSLEPRVRDALRISCYELCYLDTPQAVAASQGVELVRSVTPRAAGLANAVLRRVAGEIRPQVEAARSALLEGHATTEQLSLASCIPTWLVGKLVDQRGSALAHRLCAAQLEPAPVYVAVNAKRCDSPELERLLTDAGMAPEPVAGLVGAFALSNPVPLPSSGLVDDVSLVIADVSAQLVCRIAAPATHSTLLEIGQGRGTKSVLLAAGEGVTHPSRVDAIDTVPSKVRLARARMEAAGLAAVVFPQVCDGCALGGTELPAELDRTFDTVLVDAPCSGTGTIRRHPEIAAHLTADDICELATLQLELLTAASARVRPGGTLVYATCSVLQEEDEDIVAAFLDSEAGASFVAEPVSESPACKADPALAQLVAAAQTEEGYLLTMPAQGAGDGHFCARLVRRS